VIELKSADEIGRMAVTGRFVGDLLAELSGVAAVGVNLMDLEHHARRRIKARGAESCYWDYAPSFGRGPFRNVLCLSVNDAVLHGLPHDYVLRDGDLLSIDMAVGIDGWVADSALSVIVGTPDPADLRLIEATEVALEAAIAAARPGARIGDISAAIGAVAGWFLALDLATLHPLDYEPIVTFYAYAILVLGGLANYWGVMAGAVIFWVIVEGTRFLDLGISEVRLAAIRFAIAGLILILIMVFRPQGLFGKREEMVLGE
jgi:methionine aminopeptidase